jgi:prevent-host-death family protein
MKITATEFKANLGKYLEAAHGEEIIITKNGKAVARLNGAGPYPESGARAAVFVGEAAMPGGDDEWVITRGGVPWARVAPFEPKRAKRKLGFLKLRSAPETDAALFEPIMTEEDWETWDESWKNLESGTC